MESVERLRSELENLLKELDQHEQTAASLDKKMDELVRSLVENGQVLTSSEVESLKNEISSLGKEEEEIETLYAKKRNEIFTLRQKLRSTLIESAKNKKDDSLTKSAMSALCSSTFGRHSIVPSSPSLRRIKVDQTESFEDSKIMSDWQVSAKELDYDKSKKVGSGAYGDVFKGRLRGKDVAIKKLSFQQFDEKLMDDFKREVEFLAKLRHPNVICFLGAVMSPGNFAVVLEFMPRGSVHDILRDEKRCCIRDELAPLLVRNPNFYNAHYSMRKPPILHLDLKSQNLLVDANFTVKVSDFGLSQVKTASKSVGRVGSPLYMAPEVMMNKPYDELADVYSFGVVLYELISGEEPYKNKFKSLEELYDAVTKKGARPDIPETCPPYLKELIQRCWNPSPSNRPSFSSMLKSNDFDKVLIDYLISPANELGRQVWRKNFLDKTYAPWSSFLLAFAKELGFTLMVPDPEKDFQIQCLKEFVSRKVDNQDIVTLEDFGKALEWFGPLEMGKGVLSRMEDLIRLKGFFGAIEATEAEKLLAGKKKGAYLLRFSTREPGSYAITAVSKQGIRHYRISHKAGTKYFIGNTEYDTLAILLKGQKKEIGLDDPLRGSKYEGMVASFDKHISALGYGVAL